jgi:hypothetical protein
MKDKLTISLESKPDVLDMRSCNVSVCVRGDVHKLAQMFALMLKQHPGLLFIVIEAITNLDNVKSMGGHSNN